MKTIRKYFWSFNSTIVNLIMLPVRVYLYTIGLTFIYATFAAL